MCLPYRRIEDVISNKLSKDEILLLIKMLQVDIQSATYLKKVSDNTLELIPSDYIVLREEIIRKLKMYGCD